MLCNRSPSPFFVWGVIPIWTLDSATGGFVLPISEWILIASPGTRLPGVVFEQLQYWRLPAAATHVRIPAPGACRGLEIMRERESRVSLVCFVVALGSEARKGAVVRGAPHPSLKRSRDALKAHQLFKARSYWVKYVRHLELL